MSLLCSSGLQHPPLHFPNKQMPHEHGHHPNHYNPHFRALLPSSGHSWALLQAQPPLQKPFNPPALELGLVLLGELCTNKPSLTAPLLKLPASHCEEIRTDFEQTDFLSAGGPILWSDTSSGSSCTGIPGQLRGCGGSQNKQGWQNWVC